jgi:photosystem II stability/assembly factor-like uncharacterized protein
MADETIAVLLSPLAASNRSRGRSRALVSALAGVLAVLAATNGPEAAADTLDAETLRQGLFSVCFANDNEGFTVGDLGRIFHTVDSGKTWEIQSAGTKRPFVSVSCIDAQRAWIAGQAGQIATTTDAGKTWTQQKSGTEQQLLSIKFIDAQNGMAVGDFGTILRTEDGGATWSKVTVPTDVQLPEDMIGIVEPGDIVLYSLSYGDANHVGIVGEFGVILVSEDGGRTFQSRRSNVETTLFGIFMGQDGKAWAVGLEAEMLSSVDSGATWTKAKVPTPPGFSLALYDLEVRGNRGWAVGNSGYMLTSTDGGSTWTLVDVPPQMGSYWLREVSLLPNGKGYAVGANGLILKIDGSEYRPNKQQL